MKKPMRFKTGMRVRFTVDRPPAQLQGKTGTVVRLLMRARDEAWVEMDEDLHPSVQSFRSGDPRARHILVFDDEVEEIAEVTA